MQLEKTIAQRMMVNIIPNIDNAGHAPFSVEDNIEMRQLNLNILMNFMLTKKTMMEVTYVYDKSQYDTSWRFINT